MKPQLVSTVTITLTWMDRILILIVDGETLVNFSPNSI